MAKAARARRAEGPGGPQTTCTLRPFLRLRLMSLRPLCVRMRALKPIFRARLILEILRG